MSFGLERVSRLVGMMSCKGGSVLGQVELECGAGWG